MTQFHAHTLEGKTKDHWEPLFTPDCPALTGDPCAACESLDPRHGHLNKVAWWTAKFSAEMFPPGPDREAARQWGHLTGLWHDLGKFASEWQSYLEAKSDPHTAESTGTPAKKEDHSTAGAVFAHGLPPFGPLLSYLIAGHHAGLADASYLFNERLGKPINEWRTHATAAGVPFDARLPTPPLTRPDAGNDGLSFLLRFVFSCLVDADFLATEAFMQPERTELRQPWPDDILERMLRSLESHITEKFSSPGDDPVHQAREIVRRDCVSAADRETGFFSLTVPTGGGKTSRPCSSPFVMR